MTNTNNTSHDTADGIALGIESNYCKVKTFFADSPQSTKRDNTSKQQQSQDTVSQSQSHNVSKKLLPNFESKQTRRKQSQPTSTYHFVKRRTEEQIYPRGWC